MTTYPPPPPRDPRATYVRTVPLAPMPRPAHKSVWVQRPSSTKIAFTIHWDRVILSAIVGVVFGVMAYWGMSILADAADPWNGVPVCTDEIADAGGICHGEPQ